jgi:AcrR family transcriptional regulator
VSTTRAAAKTAKKKTTKKGAKGSRAPAGLTPEKIRDEALALIDADGVEEFSTRKLGRALGCEAMAIYWYYPSKDALLDAVVEALVSRIGGGPGASSDIAGGDWVGALRKVAHAYRRLAHAHPKAFPLLATRRFATDGTFGFLEGLFELARAQGIADRTTARFFRVVSSYCSGVALDEIAGLREATDPKPAAVRAKFARVAAVSTWLEPKHYDDVFSFGLEILLDALTREAGEPREARGKGR